MEHEFNPTFNGFMSIVWCLLLSAFYLASLHVWNSPFNSGRRPKRSLAKIMAVIQLPEPFG
ncbi:hypothetical protein HUJ04_004495 [Dendroctonus ponderosae]|nr:hypothetical protein HUJ04_004495 [Dendroctonus ponderosae]KAH1007234.1 hypothetical protein HUJ04_004495 [Dendroctonus ponderosae]KAH1014732.1 hypothetical protein HUJ05_012570 [Dendroctonus ponderosae]KAH1014733.1 hypothetical protein HUJ05_012570 [Dendroctonus ponderosae]